MSSVKTQTSNTYIYGPVKSWRAGTSLGIDPIGSTSSCSFNCAYCQLGQIQNITTEIKTYVPTEYIIKDLEQLIKTTSLDLNDIDVITFAGSGEPTLAANLDEMILAIRDLLGENQIPISILSNATMLNDPEVRRRISHADLISLKLDAPNDEILKSINQPAPGVSMKSIINGIKALRSHYDAGPTLQLQMMFMPKFIRDPNYIKAMADIIKDLGINKLQINTPTRARPISKTGEYWIDTRGNHYGPGEADKIKPEYIEFTELPVISRAEAIELEDQLRELLADSVENLEIINVYQV